MSKELEALEALRYRITNFNGKFHDYKEIMWTIETALEALEIIKEKGVDVQLLKYSKNFVNYNWCVRKDRVLTKEEFDLLKDVLLCVI